MTAHTDLALTDEDMRRLADIAVGIQRRLAPLSKQRRIGFIRNLIRTTEVVYAIWPDPNRKHYLHGRCIKGADLDGEFEATAILVADDKTADILRTTAGDGAPVITHGMPSGVM